MKQAHLDISMEILLGMLRGEHRYAVTENEVPTYAHVDDVTYLPMSGIIRLHFDCNIPGDPIMQTLSA
jgi:hypothetical protein